MSQLIDITGMKAGRLTAIKRMPNKRQTNGRTRVMYLCQCDCGNTKIAAKDYFMRALKGKKIGTEVSCGCAHNDKARIRGYQRKGTRNLNTSVNVGDEYGFLTVIERAENTKGNQPQWKCECVCGKHILVTSCHLRRKKNPQMSCGCIEKSRLALSIEQYFIDHNICYQSEVSFSDCINPETGFQLRFDYMVNDILIEAQGMQHRIDFKSDFGIQQRCLTDNIKKEYCKQKHIHLYEIWYNDNVDEKLNEIFNAMPIPC